VNDIDINNNIVENNYINIAGDADKYTWGCAMAILDAWPIPGKSVIKDLSDDDIKEILLCTTDTVNGISKGDIESWTDSMVQLFMVLARVGLKNADKAAFESVFIIFQIKAMLEGAISCGNIITIAWSAVIAANNAGVKIQLWEVLSGTNIIITNESGSKTGIVGDTIYEEIEGSAVIVNNEGKYILLPSDTDLSISIQGTHESELQVIHVFPAKGGIAETLYYKIHANATTQITSTYKKGGINGNFLVDYNGDGTIDESIKPLELSSLPPILSEGNVSPSSGKDVDLYTFNVKYNGKNTPKSINVIIDENKSFVMQQQNNPGNECSKGCPFNGYLYAVSITGSDLIEGTHHFRFVASDGELDAINDIGIHEGPTISSSSNSFPQFPALVKMAILVFGFIGAVLLIKRIIKR
jgi:hypothetical protein